MILIACAGVLILKEKLSARLTIGSIIISLGVILVSVRLEAATTVPMPRCSSGASRPDHAAEASDDPSALRTAAYAARRPVATRRHKYRRRRRGLPGRATRSPRRGRRGRTGHFPSSSPPPLPADNQDRWLGRCRPCRADSQNARTFPASRRGRSRRAAPGPLPPLIRPRMHCQTPGRSARLLPKIRPGHQHSKLPQPQTLTCSTCGNSSARLTQLPQHHFGGRMSQSG